MKDRIAEDFAEKVENMFFTGSKFCPPQSERMTATKIFDPDRSPLEITVETDGLGGSTCTVLFPDGAVGGESEEVIQLLREIENMIAGGHVLVWETKKGLRQHEEG